MEKTLIDYRREMTTEEWNDFVNARWAEFEEWASEHQAPPLIKNPVATKNISRYQKLCKFYGKQRFLKVEPFITEYGLIEKR